MDAKFLTGRRHRTRVGDGLSSIAPITSGVVHDQFDFILYVNDLSCVFFSNTVTVKLYADNIKLHSSVDLHVPATFNELQDQLCVELSLSPFADRREQLKALTFNFFSKIMNPKSHQCHLIPDRRLWLELT
jgi:hypothetical protein